MANFWEKKFKKINKSVYDLSKELNIPEEKVKEIIKGEREVPNKEVDRVNQSFSTNKQKITSIERALMEKFFRDNSVAYLKEKFNYKSNQELCNAIGVSNSILCKLGNKAIKELSDTKLQKVYDFFQDEFNMKVNKNKTKSKYKNTYYQLSKNSIPNEVLEWYENTDIKKIRNNMGISQTNLLLKLGFDSGYLKTLVEIEAKKYNGGNWILVQQLYNYYNGFKLIYTKNGTSNSSSDKTIKVARKYAYYIPKNELSKEILDWYENTDLKKLYKKKGITIKELNLKLGFADGYKTILNNFISKHINDRVTTNYIGLLQLYNYFNGLELVNPYAKTKEELYGNINTPTFEYEPNDNIELLDIEPIENSTCESNNNQDSTNTLDNIETLEESKNNSVLEQESTPIEKELDKCEKGIAMFVTIDEYKKLKKELKRYQWLIDKLMEKYEN